MKINNEIYVVEIKSSKDEKDFKRMGKSEKSDAV